jgi:hypothetical protein
MILDLEPDDELEDKPFFVQINTDSVSGGPKTYGSGYAILV